MREAVITLGKDFDEDKFKRLLRNVKGILKISFIDKNIPEESVEEQTNKWLEDIRDIRLNVDPTMIDLDDPKTKYLMSK